MGLTPTSRWPLSGEAPHLEPVAATDFDDMVALRIRAMRPSLEALGRFDPVRARQRLADGFAPVLMRHIVVAGARVGFTTMLPAVDGLSMELEHLYIEPTHQGRGIGAWAVVRAKSLADHAGLPLHVQAVRGSAANAFYRRHGFVEIKEGEWDIDYVRQPHTNPIVVVREMWARFQARDWVGARSLLHDDLIVNWWASAERIKGAAAFIAVNAAYPEGWSIHPMRMEALDDGGVLAFLRVEHPPQGMFLVQQRAHVRDGRIAGSDELWATCEPPPAWRMPDRFPGLERMA